MNAYSMDLRERVVAAYDDGEGSQAELASRFRVSISGIGKLLRRRRQTGSIAPKPHSGGRLPAVGGEAADRLRAAVQADPDATLAELRGTVGVACSVPAVHRAPSRMGITRKKSRSGRPSRIGRS
jgi:transposase